METTTTNNKSLNTIREYTFGVLNSKSDTNCYNTINRLFRIEKM
jgi:hypothetical protein